MRWEGPAVDPSLRISVPQRAGSLEAAVLILLAGAHSNDQGHTTGSAFAGELERKEIRELYVPAISSARE